MESLLKTTALLYSICRAFVDARRKRLRRIPQFQTEYRQGFFGDPLHICFGCSPTNPRGLKLIFFFTDLGSLAFKWNPEEWLESFPNIVHGGISGTLLDELGGNIILAELGSFALTMSMRINYLSPVYRDRQVFGQARIVARYKKYVLVQAELFDERGRILSTMTALYYLPSESQFKRVTKIKNMSAEVAAYVVKDGSRIP